MKLSSRNRRNTSQTRASSKKGCEESSQVSAGWNPSSCIAELIQPFSFGVQPIRKESKDEDALLPPDNVKITTQFFEISKYSERKSTY
jgi:hypothetical protein